MKKTVIWRDQTVTSRKYAYLEVDGKDTQIQLGNVTQLTDGTFYIESSYANSNPTFETLEEAADYLLKIASEFIP